MKVKMLLAMTALSGLVFAGDPMADSAKRIHAAADVFQEIMSTPDRGIPRDLIEKAQCIGIVPGLKRAGFIVGAKYGKGVVVCRTAGGDIAFLANHMPYVGALEPRPVRIVGAEGAASGELSFDVAGGFVEVNDNRVVLLCDEATPSA